MNRARGRLSPLALACKHGNIDVFNLLVEHNADITRGVDGCGETLLAAACEHGSVDIAKALIALGEDTRPTHPSGMQIGDRVIILDGEEDSEAMFSNENDCSLNHPEHAQHRIYLLPHEEAKGHTCDVKLLCGSYTIMLVCVHATDFHTAHDILIEHALGGPRAMFVIRPVLCSALALNMS